MTNQTANLAPTPRPTADPRAGMRRSSNRRRRATDRRGAAAMLAMLYLALLGTLALAMFSTATLNTRTAYNLADVARARATAESGLRWQAYRFENTVKLPIRFEGKITANVALQSWPAIRDAMIADFGTTLPKPVVTSVSTAAEQRIRATGVQMDATGGIVDIDARLILTEPPVLRVVATGHYRGAARSAWMDFLVTKKIRYAVVGKVPIQLGRNTLVEGPLSMSNPSKPPPALTLSDFKHLPDQLEGQINAWYTALKQIRPNKYDNRISVNNTTEYNKARSAGYTDVSGDGYVDEFDLFLNYFDKNRDGGIATAEFIDPSTSKSWDENLFAAIDSLGYLNGEDRNGNGVLDPGEDVDEDGVLDHRPGYLDGIIDERDEYAKIRGEVTLAPTAQTWLNNISPARIQDKMQGPIVPTDPGEDPVTLGSPGTFAPDPATFQGATAQFEARSGALGGGAPFRGAGRIENTDLLAADVQYAPPHVKITAAGATAFKVGQVVLKTTFDATNAAVPAGQTKATAVVAPTTVDEKTPLGSDSWQAIYRRPVFRRIRFVNVRIPKGLNALFEFCTFEGVTFVEVTKDIIHNGNKTFSASDGGAWARKMLPSGTFSNTTPLTASNNQGAALGNNLRFDNCTMQGPIASSYSTAYTHFANSWEFTNATMFDNRVDDTATIVAPQTNIEMGSFTSGKDPSTLIGVVVAGNIDIRGTSLVDGSIIVTGDGAGNTTLGYFGTSDGDTNPGAMPEGGYGRLNIRYNEHRALPDGVNIPLMLLARPRTYQEGTP